MRTRDGMPALLQVQAVTRRMAAMIDRLQCLRDESELARRHVCYLFARVMKPTN